MDVAANGLEKTSAAEQEAMVSKLHNMQWLKKASHSTSPVKGKAACKEGKDHDEDNKVEDKIHAAEDSKANPSDEMSCENNLTMDTCIKNLSTDSVAESDGNLLNKDMATSKMLLNAQAVIMQKVGEEGISSTAIQENLLATQLESQCQIDEKQKDEENPSQAILEDKIQNVACFPKSQNDVMGHFDKNNNNAKPTMLNMSKAKTPESSENDKASAEAMDKDACTKKTLTTQKTNVKSASNTALSKCCNDRSSAPFINSKRSLSNLSKSPMTYTDKHGKSERVNNKHAFTKRNSCARDESARQQQSVPTKVAENKTKDIALKSGQSKTNLEREPNKTADTSQSDQISSCDVSLNKDKTLQTQQQTTAKQFTSKSKGQETGGSSRGDASSPPNRPVDKSKAPEKAEKPTHSCKSSDLSSRESEKRNSDKNFSSDLKPYVPSRSGTFVMQYKNSTLSKPAKNKGMSSNGGHAAAYGRNPLYARNNTTPDKERGGNADYRNARGKRDCPPTDTASNSHTRTEEVRASNSEADTKQQYKKEDAQPANAKSTDSRETNTSIINNENNANLTADTKPVIVEAREKPVAITPEQSCKEEEIDKIKVDVNQSPTDASNGEIKPKDSFGLHLNENYAGPQTYPMDQQMFKTEDTQQTQEVTQSQVRNSPIVWSDLSGPMQRNTTTIVGMQQQSVPSVHSPQTESNARQTPLRGEMGRFYDQRLPINDPTRLIPNTFDAGPYAEYSVQVPSSNGNDPMNLMFDTMNANRENPSVSHRYTPNMQQRPFTPLSDYSGHSVPVSQVSRWNVSLQDGYHIEQFSPNTAQPPTMHVYNAATFGPDDFSSAQMPPANCLPLPLHHPLLYAPCMQTWNPQLHYPPVFHNSPCASYTLVPGMAGQSGGYNDVNVAPMCMHDQPQHRYIHYMPANGSSAMQMHASPTGCVKGMYGCDLNNCAMETRNTAAAVDDTTVRPNRYYKRYQDNCRTAYEVPQYTTPPPQPPISRPQQQQQQQQQQPFVPAAVNQYNIYGPPGQKYYKQNTMTFTQPPPKSPKSQKTPDFVCEDSSTENIPPIISPKEFMTNKIEQLTPRMFKPDYRMRLNTGYRQPSFQRYNSGFRRNGSQDFSKEYGSPIGLGRGIAKTIHNTKM